MATEYTIFDKSSKLGSWTQSADGKEQSCTTDNGFTIVINQGGNPNTKPAIPTSTDGLKVYQNSNITISSETIIMTKIVITYISGRSAELTFDTNSGWSGSLVSTTYTLTNTTGSNSCKGTASTKQVRISKIVVTGEPASADLGEITYNNIAVGDGNNQTMDAVKGDVFTFKADNAESMSIKVGTETTPSITSETNSISWTAPAVEGNLTVFGLTITATKGSETKTAKYNVYVSPAPACGNVVFEPGEGTIVKGSTVTITCENAKQIKYWMTENENDSEADAQTVDTPATVIINQSCWLHAQGINADGIVGSASAVQFTATEPTTAMFDFTNEADIKSTYIGSDLEAGNGTSGESLNNLHNKTLTKNGFSLTFNKGQVSNMPRWWKQGNNDSHVRMYKQDSDGNTGNTLTVTAAPGTKLTQITITSNTNKINLESSTGTLSNGVWTPSVSESTMERAGGDVNTVIFTGKGSDRTDIHKLEIAFAPATPTGISSIEAEDGEAVYFNLQGVRVDNPTKGLYIRVANGKSQKVMM